MGGPRRISPRLRQIPEDQRPYYGTDHRSNSNSNSKRTHADHHPQPQPHTLPLSPKKPKLNARNQLSDAADRIAGIGIPVPVVDDKGISLVTRVKETLRTFNLYHLQFVKVISFHFICHSSLKSHPSPPFLTHSFLISCHVQQEEQRCKKIQVLFIFLVHLNTSFTF